MDRCNLAVIGGGGTGLAAAYDLALRGFSVTLLERGELTSGTTGRHHGQLHSGARYALGDSLIAAECMTETRILRRIAADCIEYNQGLFLAVDDEGEALTDAFVAACRAAGIPATEIPVTRARALEGAISQNTRRAVLVPDGTIDAYRLPMRFAASAAALGADIRTFTQVVGIDVSGGAVTGLRCRDLRDGREFRVEADAVVNAAGPWADTVAALAGARVPLTGGAGALVAVEGRACDLVISRLRPPGDGDIVVPQRKFSIIGTTLRTVEDADGVLPTEEEVRFLLSAADELIEGFSSRAVRAAWAAVRPLAGKSGDGRSISRDIALFDHGEQDGVRGLFSVVGGKATTLRAMGELVADAVARYAGNDEPCRTAEADLRPYLDYWRKR